MQFKRHLIALSLTAALTQLTACGGGSSDSAPTPQPEPDPQPSQSLEGAAADGYLVNAQVCLDLNANGDCDPDEPSTLTGTGGKYHFDNLDAELDLSQVQLLVKVIAGQTEDEDLPGAPLEQGYSMTAPAGVVEFVSPLTTMLAAEIKNKDLDLETATAALEQALGIQDSSLSVLEDYIAGKQKEDGQGYDRIHKVAQVVARVTAKAHKAVEENGGTGGDAQGAEVADAIADTVAENLELLVAGVDEAEASGQETDVDAIAEQMNQDLPLDPTEVQEQVEENREHAKKQQSDLMEIIRQERGMFELDGHEDRFYDGESSQCIAERELGYDQIQLLEEVVTFSYTQYQGPELGFVTTEEEEDEDRLIWKEGGWQRMEDEIRIESVEEDGSVIVSSDMDGRQQIWARKLDLSDLKMKRYANGEKVWMKQFDSQLRFPDGAQGYQLTFKQLEQRAILPYWGECDDQGQWCNQINLPTGPAQQLGDLFSGSEADTAPKLIYIGGEDGISLAITLHGSLDQQQGELKLYVVDHRVCDDNGCGTPEEKESGSWNLADQGLRLDLPEWAHSFLGEERATPLFTEFDGLVRHAVLIGEGTTRTNEWSFNGVAMDALVEGVGSPALREVLEPEECGFYDNQPGDGDGDQPGEGDDKPAAPKLVADPVATAALSGLSYLAQDTDFEALIHFSQESGVQVWLEEHNSDGRETEVLAGSWVIDADHRLLLQFGEGDWVLMQLPADGLGDDTMKVTEEEDGQLREYAMNLLRPLTLDSLTAPMGLRLVGQDGDQCTLELHLNGLPADQQGSGWIDLSQCQDGEGDDPDAMELLWAQTEQGLSLIPIEPNGEVATEAHHLYWFGNRADAQVLIHSVDMAADGTIALESLDRFLLEPIL